MPSAADFINVLGLGNQLVNADTPLAGTELVLVEQDGIIKQATASDFGGSSGSTLYSESIWWHTRGFNPGTNPGEILLTPASYIPVDSVEWGITRVLFSWPTTGINGARPFLFTGAGGTGVDLLGTTSLDFFTMEAAAVMGTAGVIDWYPSVYGASLTGVSLTPRQVGIPGNLYLRLTTATVNRAVDCFVFATQFPTT